MTTETYVLPRWPIRSLHQIELTSRCNLRCVYCTSPQIMDGKHKDRPAMDMTRPVFLRALDWVEHFVKCGTQGELNLAGIGESTMHPDFIEFVGHARDVLGWDRMLCFATNGLLMTHEMAQALKPFKPHVWVSLHRPEKAKFAVDALAEAGLLAFPACDAATDAVDWAGQVDWKLTTRAFGAECPWRSQGRAYVEADGRMASCCFESTGGDGIIGHVDDEIGSARGKPYSLCRSCHQDVGIDGFRDRVEGKVKV